MSESQIKIVVRRLIFKGFLSIPSGSISFDNPTFLVGRNGSGKSNCVRAITFLAEATASPLRSVIDRFGGISGLLNRTSADSHSGSVGLGVVLGPTNGATSGAKYSFEVRALPNHGFEVLREQCFVELEDGEGWWFDRGQSEFRTNAMGIEPSVDSTSLCLPLVGGDSRFFRVLNTLASMKAYSISPGSVGSVLGSDEGSSLGSDGSNAASVLREIERTSVADMREICEILEKVVPDTVEVKAVKRGNVLSLEFVQEWAGRHRVEFEASAMSEGTLRTLGLLMAVYQRSAPPLIVIEEPEASLHPGALGVVLDLLHHASRKMQVVVTTHSPEVLDAEWITDRHIRMVNWERGATRVTEVADSSRQAIQEHLMGVGELLRSNALHSAPLIGDQPAQERLFEDLE